MSILIFILVLGALVLVHEFGHFIVAKKSGIRVDEFAIGFPPKLFSWKRGETKYSLNLLPIGGFVKIFGENPGEESINGPDKKRSFVHKHRLIQAAVLVAGVAMNMLFAWFLFSIAIMIGLPAPSGYAGDKPLVDGKTAIVGVYPDTPASKVGLMEGDIILTITAPHEELRGINTEAVQTFIGNHANKELTLLVERKGKEETFKVVPVTGFVEGRAALGVSLGQVGTLKLPFFQSIIEAGKITYYMTGTVAIGLYDLVRTALVGKADLTGVTGPIGIVGLVGDATKVSVTYLLGFVAMISINLAVINLLPFPALDGGRLLFVIIEGITRRRIKPSIANALNLGGFAVLMVLMVVVTVHDISKFF